MKYIVGLGNPGEKYQHNRHNVGFMVVERLANELQKIQSSDHSLSQGSELRTDLSFTFSKRFNAEMIQTKEFILVKPQTYINHSGIAVAKICHFYKVKYEDLYIVHDDLDIKLGSYKIQHGKGPKVHNGLTSVEEQLGTDKFWNVRIGVENRDVRGNTGIPGVVYSLQNFTSEERIIVEGVIVNICRDLSGILQGLTS